MARKKKHPEHVNHERWLISYADFITLLFAFFVVMFAVSQVDSKKVGRFQDSFSLAVGVTTNERGYLPRLESDARPLSASMLPLDELPQPVEAEEQEEEDARQRFPEKLVELEKILEERQELENSLAGLTVVRRGNDLVLRLDATAIFDSGDDRVRDQARQMLMAIAQEVRGREVMLRVEGHSDDQPIRTLRFRSNWDLSTARATSVLVELADRGRLDPKRLAAVGYAEFQPIGDNATPEGRQMNRRVDFVVSVTSNPMQWQTESDPEPRTESKKPRSDEVARKVIGHDAETIPPGDGLPVIESAPVTTTDASARTAAAADAKVVSP